MARDNARVRAVAGTRIILKVGPRIKIWEKDARKAFLSVRASGKAMASLLLPILTSKKFWQELQQKQKPKAISNRL